MFDALFTGMHEELVAFDKQNKSTSYVTGIATFSFKYFFNFYSYSLFDNRHLVIMKVYLHQSNCRIRMPSLLILKLNLLGTYFLSE